MGELRWIGTWSAAQQLPEPANQLPAEALRDTTLRQTMHLSVGGQTIRVRISNAYGAAPLHLTAVHVARPMPGLLGVIVPETDAALSFAGRSDVTIPAGADFLSDPLAFPVAPLSDLTITLHYDQLDFQPTGHPGARAAAFLAPGDQLAAATPSPYTMLEHWYLIEAVEVRGPGARSAVVALGDSITDGRGSIPNANNRWPDDLARRLAANPATRGIGVLNMGIGGNRVLLDGLGPNALARFDRDVLAQGGVRWLILLEGINDLGMLTRDAAAAAPDHEALVARTIAAYRQIVQRAHDHGIKVMAGTLPPFMSFTYYHPTPANEADRQALNAWIRGTGNVDAVADFDAALRDPAAPDHLLPAFDSGDHIHPSVEGYKAMAELIPLGFFAPPPVVHRPAHPGKRK
ncbi:MAG: SGNH/GDSL hydrolase family protein [Rhizomicrobium sp.]